ncbi:M55 family metallopeptidase [Desnuesiella massiliensis]|uniref:M55 family metallopeptidase n=1 Tax=Desnuesiella massiliensis TaxID=1650662 RepID=UPI0006E1AE0D|nr:M55 family metallopeptidase [Desnuesiella massiliensis]
MKIYISADLEGIGGILTKEQVTKGKEEYREACKLLGKEVYSLTEGLIQNGAEEIYVYDAHGTGINIPYDEMHPKAKYIMGYSHPRVRFPFLDSSFDFIIFQGYHAMAGTGEAILDHSYSSSNIYNIYLNEVKAGELYIDALIASELGVPVALVTGDDKTIREALSIMPWIKTYETKKAIARHCALIKPPVLVREEMKALAQEVVQSRNSYRLLDIPEEVVFKIEGLYSSDTDAANSGDCHRMDGRTILKKGKGIWDTFNK